MISVCVMYLSGERTQGHAGKHEQNVRGTTMDGLCRISTGCCKHRSIKFCTILISSHEICFASLPSAPAPAAAAFPWHSQYIKQREHPALVSAATARSMILPIDLRAFPLGAALTLIFTGANDELELLLELLELDDDDDIPHKQPRPSWRLRLLMAARCELTI